MSNPPNPEEKADEPLSRAAEAVPDGIRTGLDRAAEVAGDVLRGIFDALPWELGGEVSEVAGTVVFEVLPTFF